MRPPGPLEIGLILVIILIVFGAGKLPQIIEMAGKGLRSMRGKKSEADEEVEEVKTAKKSKKKTAKA
ncbi:twin-arginine translocase TatA/TatE family subunit [Chloroflexota bacterium]